MKTQRIKKIEIKYFPDKGQEGYAGDAVTPIKKINELIDSYDVLQGDVIVLKANMRAIMGNVKPQEFCECKEPIQCFCHDCKNAPVVHCFHCEKPFQDIAVREKPQNTEVLREKLKKILNDIFSYDTGFPEDNAVIEKALDAILRLVKENK